VQAPLLPPLPLLLPMLLPLSRTGLLMQLPLALLRPMLPLFA